MFKDIKLLLIICCMVLIACNLSNKKALQIDFSTDSSTIVLSNIEPAGLLQLKNKLNTDTAFQKIVSVLQTPSDNDSTSMEIEWPGKLGLEGNQLVFTPDTVFKKGKTYLVETMLNTAFANKEDLLKSEVGHRLKAEQKVLLR